MHPPPATTATAPCGEQITAARDTDLTTTNAQKAYLMGELGLSRAEAARLIKAYRADMERPLVTAGRTYRLSFLAWLMRQAPGGRRPRATPKREWRVTSA